MLTEINSLVMNCAYKNLIFFCKSVDFFTVKRTIKDIKKNNTEGMIEKRVFSVYIYKNPEQSRIYYDNIVMFQNEQCQL